LKGSENDKKEAEKEKKLNKINTAKNLINNKAKKEQQELKSRQSVKVMEIAKNLNNVIGRNSFIQPGMIPGMPIIHLKEENRKSHLNKESEDNTNKDNELIFKSELDNSLFTKGDIVDILISKPVKEVRKKAKSEFNI
jgi:hypothetical protein